MNSPATPKKRKNDKSVRFTYQVLNIKLISNDRKGTEAYKRIFEDLFSQTVIKNIGNGKKAFLKSLFPARINGQEFYWGKILKFTDLENRNDWINIITKETQNIQIDPNIFPDPKQVEFVFIPQAHRLAIRLSSDFTIINAYNYFQNALPEVLDIKEDYTVNIHQSQDVFEEIFDAIWVSRLDISISYTNSDDIGNDIAEWIDSQLRKSNSKEAEIIFKAEKSDTIDIGTPLIKGSLELAKENGEVEAKVKDKNGRNRTIITKNHAEKNRGVASSEDDVKNVIFNQIMDKHRNEKRGVTED